MNIQVFAFLLFLLSPNDASRATEQQCMLNYFSKIEELERQISNLKRNLCNCNSRVLSIEQLDLANKLSQVSLLTDQLSTMASVIIELKSNLTKAQTDINKMNQNLTALQVEGGPIDEVFGRLDLLEKDMNMREELAGQNFTRVKALEEDLTLVKDNVDFIELNFTRRMSSSDSKINYLEANFTRVEVVERSATYLKENLTRIDVLEENVDNLESNLTRISLLENNLTRVNLLEDKWVLLEQNFTRVDLVEEELIRVTVLEREVNLLEQNLTRVDKLEDGVGLLEANLTRVGVLEDAVGVLDNNPTRIDLLESNLTRVKVLEEEIDLLEQNMTRVNFLEDAVDLLEQNLTRVDQLEHNLTRVSILEDRVNLLESNLSRTSTLERNVDRLEQNLTRVDLLEQNLTRVDLLESKSTDNSYSIKLVQGLGSANCKDLYDLGAKEDGVYLANLSPGSRSMYCDMSDGGWTVIQHRFDGSVDFAQNFSQYQQGFGSVEGEFWFGLENMYLMTRNGSWELKVDIESFDGDSAYAHYSEFKISEGTGYILTVSGYSGTAGDSLDYNNGQKFTTLDFDQDSWSSGSCAETREGAWWFNSCTFTNLNAFVYGEMLFKNNVMFWQPFKLYDPMKTTVMKIRPVYTA